MSRTKPLLDDLVAKGKPLAEVQVALIPDADSKAVAGALDELAPDLSADVVPCYFQRGAPRPVASEVRLVATREALERLFGWRLERINLPRWVPEKGQYDGQHPDAFRWAELNAPQFFPEAIAGQIAGMGLTQPGCADNGAQDSVPYSLDDVEEL